MPEPAACNFDRIRFLPQCNLRSILLASCLGFVAVHGLLAADRSYSSTNDVKWTTLGRNENDSMPIGNGDLAANVWTEQNGDLVLLVAKSDAWTELGKLVKLGRIRIALTPNPFVGAREFTQTLRLEDGSIEIRSGANAVRVWVDANHPVLHVEARLARPTTMRAKLELWRTSTHPYDQPSPAKDGLFEFGSHSVPLDFERDTVLNAGANRVEWYHFNQASVYPLVMKQEHLESLLNKYPDPLLHRCFGAVVSGTGLVRVDDHTLESSAPKDNLSVSLVALTLPDAGSPQAWTAAVNKLAGQVNDIPIAAARAANRQWWSNFWNRSWIHVTGTPDAEKVSQGYILQRYMMAASSRGAYPVKFNGGLFTVGHDMASGSKSTRTNHDPDFRAWGNSYWNQNNRLLYWPLIATGDFDLLKPWFDMYVNALPLSADRTRLYFHHGGAAFIETMYFWGLPNLNDFGWDNPTNELQSPYMRYHIQGGLEVVAQMLDEYEITRDATLARGEIVPLADSLVTYYAQHWPRDRDGKIRMAPAQSIETYQLDAVNPTPDIAALRNILPRLIALPSSVTSAAKRAAWAQVLNDLPPIPVGRTAAGKLPPFGKGDATGLAVILPAQNYGPTRNVENPELYPVFPYRIYGLGKPNLALARNTFAARLFPQDTCWGQDGPEAALLGLTAVAQKAAVDEFSDYGDQRFGWFWKPGHDWIPDLDNGGTGMMTLELMMMQADGRRIELMPAWPKEWTADFKLHAPFQTTIEGHIENGKLSHLKVTPASRRKDLVLSSAEN